MKRLILLGVVAAGATAATLFAAPAAHATTGAGPLPSACVVVHGPSGATVQVGYAPAGPTGCRQLP